MNQLTELYIRLKQMENAIDAILLSLPPNVTLSTLQMRAERRQERNQAEQKASEEYMNLKSRLQELEHDYPSLKKL